MEIKNWNDIAAIITALATIMLAILTRKYVKLTNGILVETTKSVEAQAMPYFDLSKPGGEKWSGADRSFIRIYMGNHGGQARDVHTKCKTEGYGVSIEFPNRSLVLSGENLNIRIHKENAQHFTPKDYTVEIWIELFFEDSYAIKYSELIKVQMSTYDIETPVRINRSED